MWSAISRIAFSILKSSGLFYRMMTSLKRFRCEGSQQFHPPRSTSNDTTVATTAEEVCSPVRIQTKTPLRFHVIGFPHTRTTYEYAWCAYTQKIRCIIEMMRSLGHTVFVYEGPAYSSLIQPFEKQYDVPSWEMHHQFWKQMEVKVVPALMKNVMENDLILLMSSTQYPIAQSVMTVAKVIVVEFGIGYSGVIAPYRVYESSEWMHTVNGERNGSNSDGSVNHIVIPNSFDTTLLFPPPTELFPAEKYLFFIGRLIQRKGLRWAVDIAKATGMKLVVAGQGPDRDWMMEQCKTLNVQVHFVGIVHGDEKRRLFQEAVATIVMTQYIGPFEGVHIESNLCGTPCITSTWGVFMSTVKNGENGFRVSDIGEAVFAVRECEKMTFERRANIARRAFELYSIYSRYVDPVTSEPFAPALKYDGFFSRIYAHEDSLTRARRVDGPTELKCLPLRFPGTW